MPLAVRMTEGKLWIDPSPKGAHRLAASLEFNYPLAHEPGVEITQKPHGARFGQPESVWNPESRPAEYFLAGQCVAGKRCGSPSCGQGHGRIQPGKRQSQVLCAQCQAKGRRIRDHGTGNRRSFQVKSAKTRLEYDKNLDRVHILDLETSPLCQTGRGCAGNACAFWELPRYNSKGADRPTIGSLPRGAGRNSEKQQET